jgi:hypothetical protein
MENRVFLTPGQAISCLPLDREEFHTFTNPNGILIGMDYRRQSLYDMLHGAEQIEVGGEASRNLGHGLVVHRHNGPVVFVEAVEERLQEFDDATPEPVEFVPFGEEWKNEMRNFKKDALIDQLAKALTELKGLKEQPLSHSEQFMADKHEELKEQTISVVRDGEGNPVAAGNYELEDGSIINIADDSTTTDLP